LTVLAASGQEYRTDINPALRYYEGFIVAPELSPADSGYLLTNDWRGQKLPQKAGNLLGGFDSQFKLARQAAHATVACDWGIDLSAGPETLLPHLARCKRLAQMAQLRVMWDLQNGQESEARDDLLAAFALARNASQDGTLIACLVRYADEAIVLSTVAWNYHSFSAKTLQELSDGFDAAPPGKTMAEAVETGERDCSHFWLERKIVQWQQESGGDDAKVMAKVRALFGSFSSENGTNEWTQGLNQIASSATLLKLAHEADSVYDRAAEIFKLPHGQFEAQAEQVAREITEGTNFLTKQLFPAVLKAKVKEFCAEARMAMFHAAVAYKLHGESGIRMVNDPTGQGPFAFERVIIDGMDRGFRLTSAYAGRGYRETLIFVETDGPPLNTEGPKAGQATPK